MNVTIKRGITGIFIIAFILIPLLASTQHWLFFSIPFALFTFFSLHEFYGLLIKHETAYPNVITASAAGTFLFVATSLFVFVGLNPVIFAIIPVLFLWLMAIELYQKKAAPFTALAYTFLGFIWIALPFSLMNFMFDTHLYRGHIYMPLLSVFIFSWVNDTGAYLTGISFGKRRLFERISPKKSWEGFAGGIFFTLVAAYILYVFCPSYSLVVWMGFGIITAVSGVFGDLTESLFKRSIHCKDSGSIMPGHGGFLDRFDCIFFAVPTVLLYLYIINYYNL
jgi:phosphatidate cytidylyltransferase